MNVDPRVQLIAITPDELYRELGCSDAATNISVFLVDIRPNGQYCNKHIKHAENVNFSNILLRRLLKGVVSLQSMMTSPELIEKLQNRSPTTRLVLYDSNSTAENTKADVVKHAEVLSKAQLCTDILGRTVHFLDGGFATFSSLYPTLCETSSRGAARSPVCVSVSASLPISFQSTRQRVRMQTPQNDGDGFGPPVKLLPHLVLGCAKDSANLGMLRQLGVTAILNISHNCPNHFGSLFDYMEIPVEDSYQADLLSHLHTAFTFIESIKAKGGRVFVHCHAGISRSATVCIAYIMKQMTCDLTRAYDFVKTKRTCVSPNLHFMGQLVEFQKQLSGATSAATSQSHDSNTDDSMPLMQKPSADQCNKTHTTSAPSSLYLLQQNKTSDVHHQTSDRTITKHTVSTSLPSTPVSMYEDSQLPGSHQQKSRTFQSLQLSPCRIAARDTCLDLRCLTIAK